MRKRVCKVVVKGLRFLSAFVAGSFVGLAMRDTICNLIETRKWQENCHN